MMARLVHRDFSREVASFGDVVNTRRPGTFQARRKTDSDNVVNQAASTTNVQVPLDQHIYVSFTIKDGEASKSFQDLVEMFLTPGAQEMASSVDRILCGQAHRFLANRVGGLMEMDEDNAKNYLLAARERMNVNKAYPNGRNLVLSPQAETELLKTDMFISAGDRGDDGTALREASLGRILGFDTYMDQNVPAALLDSVAANAGTITGAETVGTTVLAGSWLGYVATVGEFVVIEGEGRPHVIAASTDDGTNTSEITLASGLEVATGAGADAYIIERCLVDNVGGYAAGYSRGIRLQDATGAGIAFTTPMQGQLLAFGTGGARHTYTIIGAEVDPDDANKVIVLLDRPLQANVADAASAYPGPPGSMNLAFHRNALALVSRPLILPNTALGVRSAVGTYNDVTMRVSMQYNINAQGTVVTLDLLCGVALLDENLGCVLLA